MPKKIGIIGSGVVGQSLASGFLRSGHKVMIGTREKEKLADWLKGAGKNASVGSDSEAAAFGEILVLCTKWQGAQNAINLAGKKNFSGKVLIDITNPLLFENEGQAPALALGYPDSAGATVQRWLPEAKVVKCFNTISASMMANPKMEEGTADMFMAGNDDGAKKTVYDLAAEWGWSPIDLGGIEQSYLLEAIAMAWIVYGFRNNHWTHGFRLLGK